MRVLQLIDSLDAGGAERVAVNIANALSVRVEGSFLCTTRKEGLLKENLKQNVGYLFLNKTKTIDFGAIRRLNEFVIEHRIDIIHAHSTSFFLATLIRLISSNIIIVWHDHYGNSEFSHNRKLGVLKICSKYFSHIFCVNRTLETWAKQKLKFKNTSYLSNFATINKSISVTNLKGIKGSRIICLANLRRQKDHITLLEAFKKVNNSFPEWTLHCVGKNFNDNYVNLVNNKIKELNLDKSAFLYDNRQDIYNILSQCEIGVLSSKSEGLPIALLEYGLSNLAVIATNVGECNTVITNQVNGIIVNPSMSNELADAIILYIENQELRDEFAKNFNQNIKENYSQNAQIETILKTYKKYIK